MKSFFNRTTAGLFKAIPVKAAQHLLFLAQSQHDALDRWGYHIRPVHYYEPLPDFRSITKEKIQRRRNYPGLDFDWPAQLSLVRELGTYHEELEQISDQKLFDFDNGFFAGLDAATYYALIRRLEPARVVEVGGGYSTRVAQRALAHNREEGSLSKLACIEPFPEARLTSEMGDVELLVKQVQEVPVDIFCNLQANDILFIDSSHTVKFDSDVCYLFLEILPALRPGVWIHVHDIFFPNDYPAEWLLDRRMALNEQYLVEAFLSFNYKFRIRLANHWLSLDHLGELKPLWPNATYDPGCGSSLWITTRDDR